MKSFTRKPVLIFLGLTTGLSLLFYYLIIGFGKSMPYEGNFLYLGLMWCPGIAGLVTSGICYKSVKNLGWSLGKCRWNILGYFIPFVYACLVYGIAWISGIAGFNQQVFGEFCTVFGVVELLILAVLGAILPALGEEIGWRGFLVPELLKDMDWVDVSLYSGIIWLIWHTPLIILGDYNSGSQFPVWISFLCFAFLTVGLSFLFTWLRIKSGSLWPAVFLHAGHNFIIQTVLDPLTVDKGITKLFLTEFGIGLAVVGVIVAFVCWKIGIPNLETPSNKMDTPA